MKDNDSKLLIKNTVMMYLMSIAKLVIPLISLPYLVRVLSVDCYGSVSFVKSIISYMQILIDFGFILSATKDIVLLIKKKESPSKVIGNTLYAQLILSMLACVFMFGCCLVFDMLEGLELFSFLYLLNCILSIFLFEYIFKAYEQMGRISIRYIIMKMISLVLTIIFVKGDSDILLMPIFDIVATAIAVFMVAIELKKMNVKIDFRITEIKEGLHSLKNSLTYFFSNFATTAFSILNTLIIGLFLTEADVAYWALAIQMVGVIQCLYDPIINSVFPMMIRKKEMGTIHKIMKVYMPLIILGCSIILIAGTPAVELVFGKDYTQSAILLKCLCPLLLVSFPAMLYGWPCLGAIDKQKQATWSTISAATFQILGLIVLILIGRFTLIGVVIVRNLTEIVLMTIRMTLCYKNKKLFDGSEKKVEVQTLEVE